MNALEVLKHLPRTNCRECGLPTCLAFAAAVVAGQKRLRDCPFLLPEVAARLDDALDQHTPSGAALMEHLEALKKRVVDLDFAETAARLEITHKGRRLAVHCLGRLFEIDRQGTLTSQCHANPWVHLPLLNYLLDGAGQGPTGEWLPFRSLTDAREWGRFFEWRCEAPLQRLTQAHPELVFDILDLFGARPHAVEPDEGAPKPDYSVVVWPLPKVPFLIRYWRPDGDFESELSLLFDSSINTNLAPRSLFQLGQGIVEMLTRFVQRHGPAYA